jgi:hypothetical protein
MIAKTLARTGAIAAAFVVLTAASRDSVPQYYTHVEYHSWGTRTAYNVVTTDDYDACSLAE